jgi:maleylacetoacetate isomerase
MPNGTLFGYYRSSAAYRVRIAINLKGIESDKVAVHLRKGEQRGDAYRAINPAGLVPVWREVNGFALSQSLAIIEYLDALYPDPPLIPADCRLAAYAREIALTVACDIHPVGNLRVLEKLTGDFGAADEYRSAWNRHFISAGFAAIEARLAQTVGRFAVGDTPSVADICLVPQLYNARRFGLDLSPFPRLSAVAARAGRHRAFAAAHPDRQSDAE